MPGIHFYSHKISFKLSEPKKMASWLMKVCAKEKKTPGSVSYIFCSDGFLQKLNEKFLNHSGYTDILSFPTSETDEIDGEIYISIPRVKANARTYSQPYQRELRRVMVHGLLHFLGYRDKKASEKAEMRDKEEAYLSLWP